MAQWPPITITLTDQGATIYTAGVHTTTLPMTPTIHADALAVAHTIAQRYNRTLPITATGPEGTFTMSITPQGALLTQDGEDPGSEHDAPTNQPTPGEGDAPEDLTNVPLSLPTPARLPTPPRLPAPASDEPQAPEDTSPQGEQTQDTTHAPNEDAGEALGEVPPEANDTPPHRPLAPAAADPPPLAGLDEEGTTWAHTAAPTDTDAHPVIEELHSEAGQAEDTTHAPHEDAGEALGEVPPEADDTPPHRPLASPGRMAASEDTQVLEDARTPGGPTTQEIPVQAHPWASLGPARTHEVGASTAHTHGPGVASRRRMMGVLAGALLLLVSASGIAVTALNSQNRTATPTPTPLVIQESLTPTPTPTPTPSQGDTPQSLDTESPTPTPDTAEAEPEPPAQTQPQAPEPEPERTTAQPQAPAPAPEPVHTQAPAAPQPVAPASGITAMNTSLSTSGGGRATVSVSLSGSGSTTITATIAGVSTTMHANAPGTASATLTGLPTGPQSWTTTGGGLTNSGTITVY